MICVHAVLLGVLVLWLFALVKQHTLSVAHGRGQKKFFSMVEYNSYDNDGSISFGLTKETTFHENIASIRQENI